MTDIRAGWSRRRWLSAFTSVACAGRPEQSVSARAVELCSPLRFPRDHGAHPARSTEWWYITGWLRDETHSAFGMQITFFRNRPRVQDDNPSRFAPKQLLFAHAAVSDPGMGRLQYDQRSARAGWTFARAGEDTTDVCIDDWSLILDGTRYRAHIAARSFELALEFAPTQVVMLQGQGGFSRKGPRPGEA